MKNSNTRANIEFISFADFSSCIHPFTLMFKDKSLEKEYPEKSIKPFNITIFFKIFLYALIVFTGFRRIELMILAAFDNEVITGSVKSEVVNFILFAAVVVLEIIAYFCKHINRIRGLFVMSYMFVSISFSSYYTDNTNLSSVTMYPFLLTLGEYLSTCAILLLG